MMETRGKELVRLAMENIENKENNENDEHLKNFLDDSVADKYYVIETTNASSNDDETSRIEAPIKEIQVQQQDSQHIKMNKETIVNEKSLNNFSDDSVADKDYLIKFTDQSSDEDEQGRIFELPIDDEIQVQQKGRPKKGRKRKNESQTRKIKKVLKIATKCITTT